MRARALAALAALALALALTPSASAAPSRLDGSCSFAGPIKPTPPITLIPRSGAHFSFNGSGHCDGHLDGVALSAAPVAVTFTNVETVFDTCELGPDVNLHGTLTVAASHFEVTVDLARLVLAGPLRLTTTGGGLALGSAQFQPGDSSTAPQQCVGAGVDNATLAASFTTLAPLVGETRTPTIVPPSARHHHRAHPKRRPTARRRRQHRTRHRRLPARHGQRVV
jgi:hypothetical protein